MIEDIISRIKTATPEEKAELAAVMAEALKEQKPKPTVRPMGEAPSMVQRDDRGKPLTAEEIWDREHPILPLLKTYGFTETTTNFHTGKTYTKRWTDAEVDEYNAPIKQKWLEEKRKVFPNAQLPPTMDSGNLESRFEDGRYTHPTMS